MKKYLMPLCHPKKGRVLAKAKPVFNDMNDEVPLNLKLKQPNIMLNLLPPEGNVDIKQVVGTEVDPKITRQRQL